MKLKERFPILTWFLGRSILYYALTALIFLGSIEFYLCHYFQLKQLQQLNDTGKGQNLYAAINYHEHLVRIGAANKETSLKLAMDYLTIGDLKGAAEACQQVLKYISAQSPEYPAIVECSKY